MAEKPDNVVLTKAAAAALRREFLGWQCRLRQMAARESGGRPSSGMRPRVTTREGHEIAPGHRRADRRGRAGRQHPALPPSIHEDRGPERALRQDPGDPPGELFPAAGPILRCHDRAVRCRVSRGGPAPEPWPLRARIRAICPGLPDSLRRRRAGPAPSLLPGHLLAQPDVQSPSAGGRPDPGLHARLDPCRGLSDRPGERDPQP